MIDKIINISELDSIKEYLNQLDIEVDTPDGYKKIEAYSITSPDSVFWNIETNSKRNISCSKDHLIMTENGFMSAENIIKKLNSIKILTVDGSETIAFAHHAPKNTIDLVDIQVDGGVYYANEIVVHNSNILNSITYGLYNETFDTRKKEKNRDNKFINYNNNKDYSQVTINIEINGIDYELVRRTERKWNRKHDEITGVSTKITYSSNDTNLTEEGKVKTQKLVEKAIGDFDEFITKTLVNADTLNEILTIDNAKFIDGILRDTGIDIYGKKLDVFKNYLKDEYKKESKINIDVLTEEKNIDELEVQLHEKRIEVDTLKDNRDHLSTRISNGNASVDKLRENIKPFDKQFLHFNVDGVNIEISGLLREKDEKLNSIKNLETEIDNLNEFKFDETEYNNLTEAVKNHSKWSYDKKQEIRDQEKLINDNKYGISVLNGKIHNILNDNKLLDNQITLKKSELDSKIKSIEKEISVLENSKTCPVCKQEKGAEAIQEILNIISDHKINISKIQTEIDTKEYELIFNVKKSENNLKIEEYKTDITKLEELISECNGKITLIEQNIGEESIKILEIEEKISGINIIINEIKRREKLQQELSNIPLIIENIELKIQNKNDLLIKYNLNQDVIKENTKIQEKIDTYNSHIQQFKIEKESLDRKIDVLYYVELVNLENKIKNIRELIEKYVKQQRILLIRDE